MLQKYTWPLVGILLAFILIVSLMNARGDSLTYDEIAHIGSGLSYLTEHDYRLNPEHPPILKILSALPLLVLHPTFDVTTGIWSWEHFYNSGEYGQWDAGRYLLFDANDNTDQLVFWVRMPLVLLATAFGIFLFYWGKKIGGAAVGLFALLLYAFDPNILGHDHLVTTDIGAAAAISVVLYFFLRFLQKPSWKNTLLFGIIFGVANAVKFSIITTMPFLVVIAVLYIALQKHSFFMCYLRLIGTYLLRAVVILVIALGTIYLIYIPFSYATPASVLANITPLKINGDKAKNVVARNTILAMNEPAFLRPLTLYVHGVSQVFYRVAGGQRAYFMGTVSSNADVRYFPTVFVTKEQLAYLFLYVLVGSIGILLFVRSVRLAAHVSLHDSLTIGRDFLRAHFTVLTLGLFVVFYTVVAVSSNLTIGFRHLFPILPPLYLLTAAVLVGAYKKLQKPLLRRWVRVGFAIVIAAIIVVTLRAYPTYLAYFNALGGGTDKGYTIVADSNTDWGQESIRLKKFIADNHINKIRVDYFGGDNISIRLGDAMIPWWDSKRPVEPGYYAISATLLQDSLYSGKPLDESYSWTHGLTPYAVLGGSIVIYKVE